MQLMIIYVNVKGGRPWNITLWYAKIYWNSIYIGILPQLDQLVRSVRYLRNHSMLISYIALTFRSNKSTEIVPNVFHRS